MKMFHYLSTVTSDTQVCKFKTPTLKQGFGETTDAKLHYIIIMITTST